MYSIKRFSRLEQREYGKFSRAAEAKGNLVDYVETSDNVYKKKTPLNYIKSTKAVKWVRKNPKLSSGIALGTAAVGGTVYSINRKRKNK